jgi:nucleoside-diphosphate kinase
MDNKEREQTLVLIKPDALKNSLTGYVLSQLSQFHTGLRFAGMKTVNVSTMLADEHYAEHRGKIFFPSLIEYIRGNIHYPGEPPTNPHIARDQRPGCIRALGTVVPLTDDAGKIIGERMDNLIHASATKEEAEREIKLWFRPSDIPPSMHNYTTEVCEDYYYLKDNKLSMQHEPGSICFLSPGNTVWKSDLESLRLIAKDKPAPNTLASVVAKYLINEKQE